ncbi:site-specific DNA-methyltransferase [Gordonia amicalis]|uniref:site-specific DNA-methyltransferase n=1 Tax=Gordonia amicalis TaxID=89053 RepID=UPI0024BA0E00|nr:site-specific DNA-methyltransferase [Gordonia amicalis]MDJ0454088.1 site-specific DNA-methyltransferase [Gordonia amicalis]MDV7077232.1 site-specific DNA-methyltransferase [Gordonia amicalis]
MDDVTDLESLPVEQLIEMIREKTGAGVNLSFPGKLLARQIGRRVRPRNQRIVKSRSAGDEHGRSRNAVIEGDNLQALASLYRERGQVDLIVTDPPYNTGGDFRYNDKWDEDPNDPDMGEFVGSDDPAKHTKWMKFMYPRLQMMRAMLRPSGVLAICIDSRELFHLGQMLDELFGEENRLAIINWQKSYSPRSDNRHVSTATEYVLVYAKVERVTKTGLEVRTEAMDAKYRRRDGDRRLWKSGDFSGPKARTHQGMVYGLQSPFTGEIHYPPAGRCWVYPQREAKRILEQWGVEYKYQTRDDAKTRAEIAGVDEADVRAVKALVLKTPLTTAKRAAQKKLKEGPWPEIYFGVKGDGRPSLKRYLEDVKKGRVPITYWADEPIDEPDYFGDISWDHEESGHSQTGVTELTSIVGSGHGFETVKPMKLITKIIQIWCPPNGTVLDPFAGSGTTGHAVLKLNFEQELDRRFILIEQGRPENGDSYARTLTVDRLTRVITGDWQKEAHEALGGGFTFKTLEKKVDAKTLLLMERDEMVDTVIASHSGSGHRRVAELIPLGDEKEPYTYLVAKNASNEGIYLVWAGAGSNTDLTEEAYEEITEEADAAGLAGVYHVYSRRNLIVTDDVIWYQIPDRILSDFGLDVRSEPFTEAV